MLQCAADYTTSAAGYANWAAGYATGAAGYATGAAGYATGATGYAVGRAGYDTGAACYATSAACYALFSQIIMPLFGQSWKLRLSRLSAYIFLIYKEFLNFYKILGIIGFHSQEPSRLVMFTISRHRESELGTVQPQLVFILFKK